jgi:regulator of protease activity HflC (stomatin/prohibitin superfamily)
MPPDLIPSLLDLGALGSFAAFLIWQYVMMQKRLDKRDAAQARETEKREEEAKVRVVEARRQATENAAEAQKLADSFADSLKMIEASHEARVVIMRERYDVTIEKIRTEGAQRLSECLVSRDALAAKIAGTD